MYKGLGFTMLEVLISLVILTFMLFGFEAMQVYALRQTRAAYDFSVATNQLYAMVERLTVLQANQAIATEIDRWNQENRVVLPSGIGYVSGVYPHYHLSIVWGDYQGNCQSMHLGQQGCLMMDVTL